MANWQTHWQTDRRRWKHAPVSLYTAPVDKNREVVSLLRSTDCRDIWCGYTFWPSPPYRPLKFRTFENSKWRTAAILKIEMITPQRWQFGAMTHFAFTLSAVKKIPHFWKSKMTGAVFKIEKLRHLGSGLTQCREFCYFACIFLVLLTKRWNKDKWKNEIQPAATLRGSRPGVQSASLIMTSLMTS